MSSEEDAEFEEAMERLRELSERAEAAEFERLTTGLDVGDPDTPLPNCPMPLEFHPAYRGQTWLLDWLNRTGAYADRQHIVVMKPQRPATFMAADEVSPTTAAVPERITLTRRTCAGGAPYVGRPFCYRWDAGVDDFGRCVAGEARIQYTVAEAIWEMVGDAAVIEGWIR